MRPAQRAAMLPFVTLGVACVVAGGFVSAVWAPAPTEHASWAAAYLVLVAGVCQVALGTGQSLLAPRPPSGRMVAAEFAAYNAGNAAVIAGTLLRLPPVVDAGGALLVLSLVLLVVGARGTAVRDRAARLGLLGYRIVVVILLVSIPVGLVLAQLRSG